MFDIGTLADRVRDRVFQPLADAIDASLGIGPVRVAACAGFLVSGSRVAAAAGLLPGWDGADALPGAWGSAAFAAVAAVGSTALLRAEARAADGHGPWFHAPLRLMMPAFILTLPYGLAEGARGTWLAAGTGHAGVAVAHMAVDMAMGVGMVVGGCVWHRPGPRSPTRMQAAGA